MLKGRPWKFRGLSLKRADFVSVERREPKFQGEERDQLTYFGRYANVDSFLTREFLRHLPKGSEVKFLDVGVSPGTKGALTTLEAVRRFKRGGVTVEAHAVDNKMPATIAGKKVLGVCYHSMDVEKEELPPKQFDVIRASNLFQYLKNPAEVRKKILSRLREGGLFIGAFRAKTTIYQKEAGQLAPVQAMFTPRSLGGRIYPPLSPLELRVPSLRQNKPLREEVRKRFVEGHGA